MGEQSDVSCARHRITLLIAVFLAGAGWIIQLPGLTFDKGVFFSLFTALAVSGQCVLVIIIVLRRVSEKRRQLISNMMFRGGVLLTVLGLFSACLLVLLPYAGISGIGSAGAVASLLLMVGLNLGIPLVVTTMYEDDHQRRLNISSCREQCIEKKDVVTNN